MINNNSCNLHCTEMLGKSFQHINNHTFIFTPSSWYRASYSCPHRHTHTHNCTQHTNGSLYSIHELDLKMSLQIFFKVVQTPKCLKNPQDSSGHEPVSSWTLTCPQASKVLMIYLISSQKYGTWTSWWLDWSTCLGESLNKLSSWCLHKRLVVRKIHIPDWWPMITQKNRG